MNPHKLGAETVRIRRGAGDDNMGNPQTPADLGTHTGCAVYPRADSREARGREATVIVGLTVLLRDADADVKAGDEIEWARHPGVWYPVEGAPGPWYDLRGRSMGLEIALRGGAG
jgi:hypothetical protein